MADTAHGDIVYPIGTDGFSVPAKMLAMAESLDPRVIGQYATKAARTTGTSALVAANKRVVAWVDGGVGLTVHDGTAWVNLSPAKRYVGARNYGAGQRLVPSQAWVDGTAAVTFAAFAGQWIDVKIHASIRVDSSARQSAQLGANVTGATLSGTPELAPYMMVQAESGSENEYITIPYWAQFYADTGTVTIKVALAAGAGSGSPQPDLVMQQAQVLVLAHPVDAA